MLKRT
jgi:hypothetical protein